MRRLYTDIVAPAVFPLIQMTQRGMLVDPKELEQKRAETAVIREATAAETSVYAAPYIPGVPESGDPGCEAHPHPNKGTGVRKCGTCADRRALIRDWKASPVVKKALRLQTFDPTNKNHVQWLLTEALDLKWPAFAYTNGGQKSVKLPVLEELLERRTTPEEHIPLLHSLIALAHADQRLRTFLDPPIGLDGCTHPNVTVCGTSTLRNRSGRIDDDTPVDQDSYNGQNIPKDVRAIYTVPKGYVLLALDGAQIEWILTMISARSMRAVEAYAEGRDIHSENLDLLAPIFGWGAEHQPKMTHENTWSWPNEAERKSWRQVSKSFTHAIDYGEAQFNLARRMRISQGVAEAGQAGYFERWPEIPRWHEEVEEEVVNNRELRTAFGFRRRFFDVTYKQRKGRRGLALDRKQFKEALATGPQSLNAAIHLIGIRDLYDAGFPLYTVQHDEHVLCVRENEVEQRAKEAKRLLEREVPEFESLIGIRNWKPRVEVSVGRNWGPYHQHGKECKDPCPTSENLLGMKRVA